MKLTPEFINLLAVPGTGIALKEEPNLELRSFDGSRSFPLRNGIPVFLSDTSPIDASMDYRDHYMRDAEAFDFSKEFQDPLDRIEVNRLRQRIIAEVPQQAEWVLDVGCGSGWAAESLIPKNKKVISMDISYKNPERALVRTASDHHFAVVADTFALPFKKGALDCIIASEIIEHVPDPGLFIQSLLQVLKPGGKLIITTPYNEKIKYSLCIHCNQLTPHHAHLHSFTEQSIKALVTDKVKSSTAKAFNSKAAFQLRIASLLKFLPFLLWKCVDGFFVRLTGKKAYRLMLTIVK
ncbi:MAG: class I SAM-dependent methyltransferase [Chitinophagaceae bacterium]|nr:class I SAM-dependent methyltransferase [Chitinophagaceae bacterium]